ncbi:hypothetical protein RCZAHN_75 [Rhodobacter phage RcZahn]|nr:hypothetical protein RCZAHN_75 [Rhodobacter phage RcZahn]
MNTTESTVAKTIESLLQDHVDNHDPDIPQIMGMTDGTEADIEEITCSGAQVKVVLSDGMKFNINVVRIMG